MTDEELAEALYLRAAGMFSQPSHDWATRTDKQAYRDAITAGRAAMALTADELAFVAAQASDVQDDATAMLKGKKELAVAQAIHGVIGSLWGQGSWSSIGMNRANYRFLAEMLA